MKYVEFLNNIVDIARAYIFEGKDKGKNAGTIKDIIDFSLDYNYNSVNISVKDLEELFSLDSSDEREILLRSLRFVYSMIEDPSLQDFVKIQKMESSTYGFQIGIEVEPNFTIKVTLVLPSLFKSNHLPDFIEKFEELHKRINKFREELSKRKLNTKIEFGRHYSKRFFEITPEEFSKEVKYLIKVRQIAKSIGLRVEEYLDFFQIEPSEFIKKKANKEVEAVSFKWELIRSKVVIYLRLVCNYFGRDLAKKLMLERNVSFENLLEHINIFEEVLDDTLNKEVSNPILSNAASKALIRAI